MNPSKTMMIMQAFSIGTAFVSGLIKAMDEASDGGRKITKAEVFQIIDDVLSKLGVEFIV